MALFLPAQDEEEDFLKKSKEIFEYWTTRKTEDFGNARDVRKYFAQCRDR